MPQKNYTINARTLTKNLSPLRRQGIIPGIIYGQSLTQSLPIQISLSDLLEIINTPNQTIFKMDFNDETYDCILRDFQTDRLHTEILHVDFQYVKSNEVINMLIPVSYDGLSFLRSKKLILEKMINKIPVRGSVETLPNTFNVSVDSLGRGSKIFANDIPLPEGAMLLINPETIVATVQ